MSLALADVTVERAGRRLVDGVSFAAAPGRVLAVLGPNGAGKTTLLAAIAGMIAARGSVAFDGLSCLGAPPRALAERRALMAQHFDCPFGYGVREVVALGRIAHAGTPRAVNDAEAVAAGLAAAGIGALAGRSVPTLSGGERQRVAFAKAFAQLFDRIRAGAPHLLLLDEPTASLDPEHQHRILAQARAVAAGGGTVVVTLHDLALASIYADEVLVLERGRLAAHGPVAATLTPGLVARVFKVVVGTAGAGGRAIIHPLPQTEAA
ncbi:ATP-binding cassette domain-containing protein [Labrys wisconsinensis]|uniref:Iron complex transport system ATP-binding protein n=1 Tax=Labrys wisconsinensis TaxID=425677 RepID=A0ABU0J5U2_9HYPH|nr:ATP-binding cassette domain-containing protein [Labrys wisconsinensis]MDQ0469628.1 iron complex transport system ATP-binding protein [Labrys wisconsinensis]